MCPRRGFLQKAASVALLFLASRSQLIVAAFKGRSVPKFSLGDKVAIDWSDDRGEHFADFGEIVGLCYLPPENTWIYYVNWTHTNALMTTYRTATQFFLRGNQK
jgi:hypothetical protein